MDFPLLLLTVFVNMVLLLIMQKLHYRSLEAKYRRLSQEIEALEDLVSSIIEEFEEAVSTTRTEVGIAESRIISHQNQQQLELAAGSDRKTVSPPINWRQQQIVELNARGMSAADIARKLNMGLGEVNLILGLNKRG